MPRRFANMTKGLILAVVLAIGLIGLMPVWSDQTVEARASWSDAWGEAQAFAQVGPVAAPAPDAPLLAETPEQSQPMNWAMYWIPVVAPVLLALFKIAIPAIPKPALPFLCILLGAVADVIHALATGTSMNPALIPVLGAAGIGVREMVDQLKQRVLAT